ncbi:MAG: hypothetical protein CM1200mP36_02180 [Gammaproteobacteria bacterium]|nr:MAG: hypothetical protein CM1200mP36_02180 [Gammaproteobacteria bacterium]
MAAGEKLYPNVTYHPFIKLAGEITLEHSDFEWVTGELSPLPATKIGILKPKRLLSSMSPSILMTSSRAHSSRNTWANLPLQPFPQVTCGPTIRVVASS